MVHKLGAHPFGDACDGPVADLSHAMHGGTVRISVWRSEMHLRVLGLAVVHELGSHPFGDACDGPAGDLRATRSNNRARTVVGTQSLQEQLQ